MSIRENFSISIDSTVINEYDKGAVDADFKSAWNLFSCWFSKGPLNWEFFDIYMATFSVSVNSEIQNL